METIVINEIPSNSKNISKGCMVALRKLNPDATKFNEDEFAINETEILDALQWLSNAIYFKDFEDRELTSDEVVSGLHYLISVLANMREKGITRTVAYWE